MLNKYSKYNKIELPYPNIEALSSETGEHIGDNPHQTIIGTEDIVYTLSLGCIYRKGGISWLCHLSL